MSCTLFSDIFSKLSIKFLAFYAIFPILLRFPSFSPAGGAKPCSKHFSHQTPDRNNEIIEYFTSKQQHNPSFVALDQRKPENLSKRRAFTQGFVDNLRDFSGFSLKFEKARNFLNKRTKNTAKTCFCSAEAWISSQNTSQSSRKPRNLAKITA